jgi:dihydrofolate reductase
VSSTLKAPSWRNSEITGPYDAKRIQRLKEEASKGLYVSGSGTLVRALLADELVDELHLFVYPVTRSTGPRLFEEGLRPTKWTRTKAEIYDNGVVYLHLTSVSAITSLPAASSGPCCLSIRE